jgi:hypothetical protein
MKTIKELEELFAEKKVTAKAADEAEINEDFETIMQLAIEASIAASDAVEDYRKKVKFIIGDKERTYYGKGVGFTVEQFKLIRNGLKTVDPETDDLLKLLENLKETLAYNDELKKEGIGYKPKKRVHHKPISYEIDTSGKRSFYNDALDIDQQSPEFWDNLESGNEKL